MRATFSGFGPRCAGLVVLVLLLATCADSKPTDPSAPQSFVPSARMSHVRTDFIFLPDVFDDGGPNDVPIQSDLNSFSRADNIAGHLGVRVAWDDVDAWTGDGQTGDACFLFDIDGDGLADYSLCVRITNSADGSEVFQLPVGESPLLYACSGKKSDRCGQPISVVTEMYATACDVVRGPEADGLPWEGDDHPDDVIATCDLDLAAIAGATNTNMTNACTYPSGSPNSNPFDCVVTPGAGFIRIDKVTTPSGTTEQFDFTLSPASTSGETSFSVIGTGSSSLIPVLPGSGPYSLTESVAADWQLTSAACVVDGGGTGTFDGTSDSVTGIAVQTGLVTVCTFNNSEVLPTITVTKTPNPTSIPESGGDVEYTVVVTNTSPEALTVTSLTDDKFGDLNGQGTCAIGESLAASGETGDSYTCAFTGSVPAGNAGESHDNVVTAAAQDSDGNTATNTGNASVTYSDVAPTIAVVKTASPGSVPETGGDVTYTVEVTNNSSESVTVSSLTDDVFGDLDGQGTCATGTVLAASGETGDSYTCSFTKNLAQDAGTSHVNEVTAGAQDNDGTDATAQDTAKVDFTDVAPTITVVKTASPGSVPETGDDVTYTVEVTNTSEESVTLNSLTDDVFGDLDGQGSCATGTVLAASGETGDSYSCTFTKTLAQDAGTSHINEVTAGAQDNDGTDATAQDTAKVDFTDVAPTITVVKTASPGSLGETGGDVTYTVEVTNTSEESVTLNSLTDDVFGDLDGQGSCATGTVLAASGETGDSYSCSFTKNLAQDAGTSHVNEVTAGAQDNDGTDATAQDTAKVDFTDVAPTITVVKTASPGSVPETGGDVTYTVEVTNTSSETVTVSSLSDDVFGDLNGQGSCATGTVLAASGETGDSYTCSFTKNLAQDAGTSHVNEVTTGAQDNDGTDATAQDTAKVDFTDVAPTITVVKTASPGSVPETGDDVTYTVEVTNTSEESVTLNSLTDDVFGDLDGQGSCATGTVLAASGETGDSYSCSFTKNLAQDAGTSHINEVTAGAQDNDGTDATAQDTAKVDFTDVAPTITVVKTASPGSLGETGGDVTYTVEVTNTSDETVTINSLTDNMFGDLDGQGSCSTGTELAASGETGDSYSCSFTKNLAQDAGTSHVNEVTAGAQDNDGTDATAQDTAKVDFTDVAPTITVVKTASPGSVPETGGDVTYTVEVTNTSSETVTVSSLMDDVFGDLNGQGTCATGTGLAASGETGDSYTCSFTKSLAQNAGTSHVNEVTAGAQDNDGTDATAQDTAKVDFTDVAPTIAVVKTASPGSVAETGGDVTYTVEVSNTSEESVTITSLTDDVFGDLDGQGSCATGTVLAASGETGDSYTCTFTKSLAQNAGTSHVNEVTAGATDNDGTDATAQDTAKVDFTDVLPDISVTKTASPTTLPDPSATSASQAAGQPAAAGGFDASSFLFLSVCDDAGPNDEPAQSDLNCFGRADNIAGRLGVQVSWDDTDQWTGEGQTGDSCLLFDTDGDGNADVAFCVRIENTPDGSQVLLLPPPESPLIYECSDKRPDRCSKPLTQLASVGTTTCTIAKVDDAFPGEGDDGQDTQVECDVDLSAVPNSTKTNLINACSYPSGSPNSNPFDCVVQPGAAFLVITKATNPSSTTDSFDFTLSPASTSGETSFQITGSGSSALIAVQPSAGPFSITESMPANWRLDAASCLTDQTTGTGTFDSSSDAVTGIVVQTGLETECTFENIWEFSGPVTYTIEVTNHTLEAVTLNLLTDDKFGDLDGVGTCVVGGSLAPTGESGAVFTCSFTKTLSGAAGTTHTNVVTAKAADDEGNTDTDTDDATVTFGGPPGS